MTFSRCLREWLIGPAAPRSRPARRRRPTLETLEDRCCPTYVLMDLGVPGGVWSEAYALNDSGKVVGRLHTTTAFSWENGVITDLGAGGHDSSAAYDVNASGQVVGVAGGLLIYMDEMPPSHAFLWQDGVMTDIGGPNSWASAINDAGQIAGSAFTGSWNTGAAVWEGGVAYNLNSLLPTGPAMELARATDVNDRGQIVGQGYVNGQPHYFLFTDDDGIFANGGATLTVLGTTEGYEGARINNAGQVVAGRYLYSDGTITNLGFVASGINDAGQVVGFNLLWQNGQTTNLNNLIDTSSGWYLGASDINERGEIVGTGTIGGHYQWHAFLLTQSDLPALSIGDAAVAEGDSGATSAIFSVSLSEPSDQVVTVDYATANGTAAAGSDYEAVSGTLTFNPGETTKSIAVPVLDDGRDESDETFHVNLSNHTNAILTRSKGQATILDDDPLPTLTIDDVTVSEGAGGAVSAVFTVTLAGVTDRSVWVNYSTGDGTAKAGGNDYVARSGFVVFYAGETTKTIAVPVNGDTRDEVDETFVVNLSSPSNATIADGQGVATILDDDPPPALSINDVTRSEGRSGITYFVFTVSLSAASDKMVAVNFATANGTAKVSNNDYVATLGTLSFAPGETSKSITVQVKGDKKNEANETFFLNLGGAVDAVFADSQGLGTILNDD